MRVQNIFKPDELPNTFDDASYVELSNDFFQTDILDQYRQGIEIRTQKQYFAGSYKITSGEDGHVICQQPLGQHINQFTISTFTDKDNFNAVTYLETGGALSNTTTRISDDITITSVLDGAIDPLNILHETNSSTHDFFYNGTHGALQDGNLTQNNNTANSDRVFTVSEFESQNNNTTFNDSPEIKALNSNLPSTVAPFFDTNVVAYNNFNKDFVASNSAVLDNEIITILMNMNAREDSYVQSWQKSATSGFQFNNQLGTDSLAYGDLRHV